MKSSMYKITYENNFVQYKTLISKSVFEQINSLKLNLFEEENKSKKDRNMIKIDYLKKEIYNYPNNFFVVGSLMYKAIETGILESPNHQGGFKKIKIEKV